MSDQSVQQQGGGTREIQTLDILKLMECLPHRYPFLMVDRNRSHGRHRQDYRVKNVTFNEPHFLGHFPGQAGHAGCADRRGHGPDRGAACVPP